MAGQAKRFSQEIAAGLKRSADVVQQLTLEGLRDKLDDMVPLVRKVMKQTRARILRGDTRGDGKLVSLFEPETEIIRKGKASKPTFGKMVKLQEAEISTPSPMYFATNPPKRCTVSATHF